MLPEPSPSLLRHIQTCNNAIVPGQRIAFRIAHTPVGWVRPALAHELRDQPSVRVTEEGMTVTDGAALPELARVAAQRGLCRWRGEAFDVRSPHPNALVLGQIDRGAIPAFGVQAWGVHVNGVVRCADTLHLWVGRRALNKQLDPGKLDHLVAGGVGSGHTLLETLVKEAGEEAALPPTLARQARLVSTLGYAMERPEGLRRDRLYCYDLELPPEFMPRPVDGEVESFDLWPIDKVLDTVRHTDAFKFNVNLVLIDLFIRLGLVAGEEAAVLRQALSAAGG